MKRKDVAPARLAQTTRPNLDPTTNGGDSMTHGDPIRLTFHQVTAPSNCWFHHEDDQAVWVYGGWVLEDQPMRIERHRIRRIEAT